MLLHFSILKHLYDLGILYLCSTIRQMFTLHRPLVLVRIYTFDDVTFAHEECTAIFYVSLSGDLTYIKIFTHSLMSFSPTGLPFFSISFLSYGTASSHNRMRRLLLNVFLFLSFSPNICQCCYVMFTYLIFHFFTF